ncbi:hypothetical protein SDC9_151030 [bioreactor metagenome]|uniref:Uncharacterized protein n=1 Tax=bioreactor metagenome TaxID=1076179 RepID=A0A645EQS6_9ZZZZ
MRGEGETLRLTSTALAAAMQNQLRKDRNCDLLGRFRADGKTDRRMDLVDLRAVKPFFFQHFK